MSFIVGIAGGSGSGKTTFKRKLAERFSEAEICLISQDDYYKPTDAQLIDSNGVTNYDMPTSIDEIAFADALSRLRRGETIERLEYTFGNPNIVPKTIVFRPAPIILVEGLFVLHHESVRKQLDFSILVDAKDVFKVSRRIRRDAIERGYELADVLYRYENHVMPSYDRYIAPFSSEVDIIINNNSNFERAIDMTAAYLHSLL